MANVKTNITEKLSYDFKRLYKRFSEAPLEIKVFAIFAATVSTMHLIVTFILRGDVFSWYSENLRTVTGSNYMFVLLLLSYLIFTLNTNRRNRLRFFIIAILAIPIVFYPFIFLSERLSNYLEIIFSIVIPVCWILLMLFSPAINRFCKNILLR